MPDGPTLSLPIDASGARRGAQEFVSAVQAIEAAGQRASSAIAGLRGSIEAGSNSLRRSQSATQTYAAQLQSLATAHTTAGTSAKSYADSLARSSAQVSNIGKAAAGVSAPFAIATTAVGSFVGGLAAMAASEVISFLASLPGQVLSVSAAYENIDSRIRLYTASIKDTASVHEDLLNVADRTRTSFESTGGFFAKVASQAKNLQLSYEEMIQLTETLQQGFRVSGASANETASAMQQLGQAFAKGKLNGDELVSVSENAPRVMDALSEAFGVNQAQIRQWAQDGDLSAQAVAAAIISMREKISSEFSTLGRTTQDATVQMQNAFNELIKKFDETSGTSSAVISALDGITAWMKSPSGEQAIQDFATVIGDLVSNLADLIGQAGSVVSAISSIGGAALDAAKAIGSMIPRSPLDSMVVGAIGKAGEFINRQAGYTTGGGFGGEFDTPGNISAVIGGDKPLTGIGIQVAPGAGAPAPAQQPARTPQQQQALRQRFGLVSSGGVGGRKTGGGRAKVDPSIAGLERAREQLARQQEDIELFGKERDQAIRRAVDALGKYATPEMKTRAADMAGTLFDLGELQKQKDALDQLSSSVRVFGDERAKAEESAVKQLGDFATPEQVQQARDLANQLLDLQDAKERNEEAEQRHQAALQEGESVYQSVMTEQERYYKQVSDLNYLLAEGAISQDTYNRAIAAAEPPTWSTEILAFGNQLNSFDNQFQTLQSGIMGFTSLVSDAFTDAIFSGESFGETMEKLGMSIAEMTTKLLIQLALQQAIGAGLQGMMGAPVTTGPAQSSTPTTPFMMEQGATVVSSLPQGVYTQPTYFAMREPGIHAYARGAGLMGESGPEAILPLTRDRTGRLGVQALAGQDDMVTDRTQVVSTLKHTVYNTPTYFKMAEPGEHRLATGLGLLGEAGPEAVLPLTRSPDGKLGVRAVSPVSGQQSSVLPLKRTSSGFLGVQQAFAKGGVLNENEAVAAPAFSKASLFAYGDAISASLPHGVYRQPTLFPVQAPGFYPMARGTGVVGEAGPEAVLPLVRGPGGSLGVQADAGGGGSTVNVIVNNNSKADVSTEHKENADGGTDVMITIADHVENIVATRMMRSGTKVNKAVPQVGRVVAR